MTENLALEFQAAARMFMIKENTVKPNGWGYGLGNVAENWA